MLFNRFLKCAPELSPIAHPDVNLQNHVVQVAFGEDGLHVVTVVPVVIRLIKPALSS